MKGKVQTVLGLIEPDNLGITLTHEHLFHALPKVTFKQQMPQFLQHLDNAPLSLETLGWIRQYPYCFDDNLEFNDTAVLNAVEEEMLTFKQFGGGTIVDNGSIGLRDNAKIKFLQSLSKKSGVNIITATGFYCHSAQSPTVLNMSEEEMELLMKTDILEGIDNSNIKCGVIGEIGCSWPLHSFEKKSLISSAVVQEEICCPVIIHPGRNKESPEEILRIFQEAGGIASQTVMSHLERTFMKKEDLAEFASMGCFCEFDLFGIEVSHYQLNEEIDMPSDAQRIQLIHYLIAQGFEDRIVISHDIHTKHRLVKFGGHGFSHIIVNVLPKMLKRGIEMKSIEKMVKENPKNWLTFK